MDEITTQTSTGDDDRPAPDSSETALLDDELLIEEISIDGMCGVY